MAKITHRIRDVAMKILDETPEGIRYSDLVRRIREHDSAFNQNTIHGTV